MCDKCRAEKKINVKLGADGEVTIHTRKRGLAMVGTLAALASTLTYPANTTFREVVNNILSHAYPDLGEDEINEVMDEINQFSEAFAPIARQAVEELDMAEDVATVDIDALAEQLLGTDPS
jgi:hypothetical protein